MAREIGARRHDRGRGDGASASWSLIRTGVVVVLLGLPISVDLLWPSPAIPSPYNFLGLLAILTGLGVMFWAWTLFKARGTTLRYEIASATLVTSGPFRVSRNPMYLGAVAAFAGLCVLLGSAAGFVCPLLYLVAIDRLMVRREEQSLERQFGAQYTEYRRRVRRWL
jgi:protein-S-isoprenylcysteine O-methyltransferase Ste14